MTIAPLDHQASGYSMRQAYWLCRASVLAYEDEDTIRAETGAWGFDRFRFVHSEHEASFALDDTQAFLAGSDDMLIVVFRGTEPTNIRDWLSDVNAPAAPGPGQHGMVHLGFSQALDSVYSRVRDTIEEFRTNEQTVWITGHSLGGALAMLAGARLYFEVPNLLPTGVYTFGQPRTCDSALAEAYDAAFASRCFRFVNNNDVVPTVPPEPLYSHVQSVRYLDSDGQMHENTTLSNTLGDRVTGFTADPLAPASDGLRDHFGSHYLTVMEKNLD